LGKWSPISVPLTADGSIPTSRSLALFAKRTLRLSSRVGSSSRNTYAPRGTASRRAERSDGRGECIAGKALPDLTVTTEGDKISSEIILLPEPDGEEPRSRIDATFGRRRS
jgi:hypothetical protein